MRTLGIIPARGGSKRFPGKNIALLNGSPVISYTIQAAKQAKSLTDWVVTTDEISIAQVAVSCGSKVHMRGEMDDEHTSIKACKDALAWMERTNEPYDMVALLHPTSPIRCPKQIDEAVAILAQSDAPSLASVSCRKRCYVHNASLYVIKTPLPDNHYSEKSIPYLMDDAHSVDIDEETDLKIAEIYLKWQA